MTETKAKTGKFDQNITVHLHFAILINLYHYNEQYLNITTYHRPTKNVILSQMFTDENSV